ncbi:MAG: hypothetical protein RLN82_03475 [Pseudomonadales bacterium]
MDETIVTGEPLAVRKEEGNQVIGGNITQQGSFIMRADKISRLLNSIDISPPGRIFSLPEN